MIQSFWKVTTINIAKSGLRLKTSISTIVCKIKRSAVFSLHVLSAVKTKALANGVLSSNELMGR